MPHHQYDDFDGDVIETCPECERVLEHHDYCCPDAPPEDRQPHKDALQSVLHKLLTADAELKNLTTYTYDTTRMELKLRHAREDLSNAETQIRCSLLWEPTQ